MRLEEIVLLQVYDGDHQVNIDNRMVKHHVHFLIKISLYGVMEDHLVVMFVIEVFEYRIPMLQLHDECLRVLVVMMNVDTKNSTEPFMHGKSMRRRIRNDHVIVEISQMFVSRRLSDRYQRMTASMRIDPIMNG